MAWTDFLNFLYSHPLLLPFGLVPSSWECMRRIACLLMLLPILVACLTSSGCVRRRLTITSTPPGATVYVDNREIGITPVSTSFIYYGTREIRLVRDGYETLTVRQRFDPPWYQYTPVDFFAENVVPWEIRDERELTFELIPQKVYPARETLARGQQLRDDARRGLVTTLPSSLGGFFTPPAQTQAPNMAPPSMVQPQILPAPSAPGGFQQVQPQPYVPPAYPTEPQFPAPQFPAPQPQLPPPPEFRFLPPN